MADGLQDVTVPGVIASVFVFAISVAMLVLLRPTLPPDETRYLAVAWEMRTSGSWLVPLLNGEAYGHKPPLFFWLMNIFWNIFGTHTIQSRLLAPALTSGCILLVARLSARLWPERLDIASLSSWILATSGMFILFGSMTMFDGLVSFFALIGLLGITRSYVGETTSGWSMVGLSLGLGALAKGPVVFLHVVPVALLMPFWAQSRCRPSLYRWYAGLAAAVLLALLPAALWLVPVYLSGHTDYLSEVLWHQSAGRVLHSFAHSRPAWFYIAALPIILWPWAWLPGLTVKFSRSDFRSDRGLRFCLTWCGCALIIFSLIDAKQPHYLMPALPAFALVAARTITSDWNRAAAAGTLRRGLVWLLPAVLMTWLVVELLGSLPSTTIELKTSLFAIAVGVTLCLLGFLAFMRNGIPATGLRSWGTIAPCAVLALHIAATPQMFDQYNPNPVGFELASFDSSGVAAYRNFPDGEFTFAARLHRPISLLESPSELADWAAAHPCGAVLTNDSTQLVDNLALHPASIFKYRLHIYRVFVVAGLGCAVRNYRSTRVGS
jgi:4-amino-4-deoxy-L-arabinose transferase-like glycosyltransferase